MSSRFMFMLGVLHMKCMKSCVVLMRIWSPLYRMERYHHVPFNARGKRGGGLMQLGKNVINMQFMVIFATN